MYPKLSRTNPCSKSNTKGKQSVRAARKKTHAKNSRPKTLTPVSIPEPPPVSSSVFVSLKLYSLGGRPVTPRDLERVRAKYNIPPSVSLRVPRKGERPEHPHSDGVTLHIDLFYLGLYLPLQPFFRKMFSEMQIAPGQLSLPSWRLLTSLELLWLDVFEEDISYKDLRGLYQLKKPIGLSVAYFTTWGRSIPAENEVMQVQNFFNEDSMCFFLHLSLYIYIYISYEFSSYSLFLGTFTDITWSKRTCLVYEVGRK